MRGKLAETVGPAKPARPVAEEAGPAAADLLAWYGRHARRLPWRVGPAERRLGVRPDPYSVWLSEIMLQQTTVAAVGPYFMRFLARWPTVEALAAADEHEVMAAWAGLGYYSRARNLIACARAVAARPGARFPDSAAELSKLPGIGAYTSAAIAALAYDESVAVVDGNAERVVARLFTLDSPPPALKELVRDHLQAMVPADRAGEFAEAVMDLGATICTPRKPVCALCPWSAPCLARREGRQALYPAKAVKRTRPMRYGHAYVVRRADGAILLRRRPPSGLLGGMSEVPGSEWREAGAAGAAPPLAAEWRIVPASVEHGFTHFELRLTVHFAGVSEAAPAPDGCWWASAESLPEEALPTVMKKVVEAAFPGATKPQRRLA